MYNNNYIKTLFIADKLTRKLLKSYFNSFNLKLEKKVNNTRIKVRFRRLSINKILMSNPDLKHTNTEVVITLYVYNRQKQYFINKIKRIKSITSLRIKKFKYLIRKIKLQGLKIINQIKKEENLIFEQQVIKGITISKNKYYTFIKKLLGKEVLIIYYKHLLYLNKSKFQGNYLNKIGYLLKKIYNKNVRFNIVNLKYIALNSDIFTESVSLKLKKRNNSLLKVLNRSLNSVNLPSVNKISEDYTSFKNKNKTLLKTININNKQTNIDVLDKILVNSLLLSNNEKVNKSLESSILTSIKYKSINGLRLEAKGRLSKRLIAAKSVFKFKYKGSLKNIDSSYKQLSTVMIRGNMKSNLQYTYLGSKTRNGSFGLKG